MPVGPSKRTLGFFGHYGDKAIFLKWRYISLSLNEIYLCLHCLKEIRGLVQHCARHILYIIWPIYGTYWRFCFALNLKSLYLLQFHCLVIFVEWNWEMKKFCLFLFLLNDFDWGIMPLVFHHFQSDYVGLDC